VADSSGIRRRHPTQLVETKILSPRRSRCDAWRPSYSPDKSPEKRNFCTRLSFAIHLAASFRHARSLESLARNRTRPRKQIS